MKKQITNPIFPFGVCIPDGEPHVFDGRVYLYGSHDLLNGKTYCEGDYVVYSAPIDDLSNWSCKGVSYEKKKDPLISSGKYTDMYAPDCVRGNDGRYYLYYCISRKAASHGYCAPIQVAVSDYPDGPFEYLGFVKTRDGNPYLDYLTFDPGVINDDGTIRLYYGAWFPFFEYKLLRPSLNIYTSIYFQRRLSEVLKRKADIMGSMEVELEDDMQTIKGPAKHITPIYPKGTSFDKHHFFEASSIRKFNGKYYFIYSSTKGHELCYAVSDYPDKDFEYKGVLISNSDIGLPGITEKNRTNYSGNNHGSLEKIGDDYYIFYHKMTHRNWYSRMDCAEKINMNKEGLFDQVEMTSQGLNGKPLTAKGVYKTYICSSLTNGKMPHINPIKRRKMPAIMDDGSQYYVERITNGTSITFKYFDFEKGNKKISVKVRGNAKGRFVISFDGKKSNRYIDITKSKDWTCFDSDEIEMEGIHSLSFVYEGKGKLDFVEFEFDKD